MSYLAFDLDAGGRWHRGSAFAIADGAVRERLQRPHGVVDSAEDRRARRVESAREMRMLTISLSELPPSANALKRPARVKGKVRLVDASGVSKWRARTVEAIKAQAMIQGFGSSYTRPVELSLSFRVKNPRSDCSNRIKALEDAITHAKIWTDDVLVSRIVAERVVVGDTWEVGVTFSISEIPGAQLDVVPKPSRKPTTKDFRSLAKPAYRKAGA